MTGQSLVYGALRGRDVLLAKNPVSCGVRSPALITALGTLLSQSHRLLHSPLILPICSSASSEVARPLAAAGVRERGRDIGAKCQQPRVF